MSGCSWLNIILPFLPCCCLRRQKSKEKNETVIKRVVSVSVKGTPVKGTIDKDLLKVQKNGDLEKKYDKNGIQPVEETSSNPVQDNDRKCSETSKKGGKSITADQKNVSGEPSTEKNISGICITFLVLSYLVFKKISSKF